MKVALYKNLALDFEVVSAASLKGSREYIRISEFVNIDFEMLYKEKVVQDEICYLQKERAVLELKLSDIDRNLSNAARAYEGNFKDKPE